MCRSSLTAGVLARALCVLGLVATIVARPGLAQTADREQPSLDQLTWRHIGPSSFGGRIDDVEAVPSRPRMIFVGTAGGGVWRSENNGVTWTPVFDAYGGSQSIGDIAIAPSDPNVIWVGTGEPNNRQSSTWGDGVYRSLDGGDTWHHMGLRDSHHVGRIVIHPRDPSTVYVAALGHLWGPNGERGLYRTRDAGQTWQQVLGVDENTGAVDVALDPDGRTMYAATYQRRRAGYGFIGGGAGSGLWRSLDGGDTWERLGGALPTGIVGRIGVAIAPSNTNTVYAVIEHREDGGVYRSDDRGGTWRRVNALNPRPMYYSQIRVDPQDPDRVWMLGSNLHLSNDGGTTFTTDGTGDRIHVDHHAMWIDPADPKHIMLGNDGGLYFTYDGSRTWDFIDNLPIGQFYDVDVDDRDPYWIFGGAQDNGTWGIPSRTSATVGITNRDVINVAYGDGFYATTDRTDSRFLFANSQNGRAYRVDLETREERGIRPVPLDPKEPYRFNWSTPQLRSPHDARVVYYGAQKLLRTDDAGQSWHEVSPDLTRKLDWKTIPLMGIVRDSTTLSRDDGIAEYGTITTIDESPFHAGQILVGTDDGNVQLTVDGGATWRDISSRFRLPGPRWVSRVLYSRREDGVAYVAFDGHYDDDMVPRVFRSADGGDSWNSIAGDLPSGNVVRAIEEYRGNSDILFAGTEFGLYVTYNGGRNWRSLRGNLPRVRVDDVLYNVRTDDLVLATHGRSFIVLDDIGILKNGDPSRDGGGPLTLAPMRGATQTYMHRMLPPPSAATFAGPNPPEGALITYVARPAAGSTDTTVAVTITDSAGVTVQSLSGSARSGMHRVAWDLRYARVDGVTDGDEGWFGPPRGPWVLPGTYTVQLKGLGVEVTETVMVRGDPRVQASRSALEARHAAEMKLQGLLRRFVAGSRLWDAMFREKQRIEDAVKNRPEVRDSLASAVDSLAHRLDSLRGRFGGGFGGAKFRFLDLDGALQAATAAPTDAQLRELESLERALADDVTALNGVLEREFAELERRARTVRSPDLVPVPNR